VRDLISIVRRANRENNCRKREFDVIIFVRSTDTIIMSKRKVRNWDETYSDFGFSVTVVDGVERHQCILSRKVFSNSSLKPSKLQEHFINKHGGKESEGQDPETLKKKKARFDNKGTLLNLMKSHSTLEKQLLHASYRVAYRIAKSKKAHTVAESLIKPCARDIVKIVTGDEAEKKFQQIPLSNDVISTRISDISEGSLMTKHFPV